MPIKDKEIQALLDELDSEVAELLKDETDRLAKAAGEEEPGADEAPPAPEASGSAEGSPGADPSEASASASAPGPADASPSPEESAPAGDPAADAGPIDPEALKAEYSQLPPEELKVHFLACKAALAEVLGGADPEAGAAPEAPAPGPQAPGPVPPPAMKAEVPASMKNPPANGGTSRAAVPDSVQGGTVAKSELNAAESKIAELTAQVEGLAKAVEAALSRPQRRAVTSVSFLGKSEVGDKEPTREEIKERLSEVAKSPTLKKSDRERIISYTVGNIGYEQIKDLLKK